MLSGDLILVKTEPWISFIGADARNVNRESLIVDRELLIVNRDSRLDQFLFCVIPAELVPAKAGSGNPEALYHRAIGWLHLTAFFNWR